MRILSLSVLFFISLTLSAGEPAKSSFPKGMFEIEGNNPTSKTEPNTLSFSALTSKYNSGNGHGYRNEVKIIQSLRRSVSKTTDHFSAVVTPVLPSGAKTIVAQYHMQGLGTELKVYVQDTKDSAAFDGVDNNGVFDILVRILGTDGVEKMTPLGQIKSGESFVLKIDVVAGVAVVSVTSEAKGEQTTPKTALKDAGEDIYFKFGDYLQALDPKTGKASTTPKVWDAYYKSRGIDSSLVKFANVSFSHE